MYRVLLSVSILALCGCASTEMIRFSKPGASQEEFMRDRYGCLQETQQDVGIANEHGAVRRSVTNAPLYNSCMAVKGYQLDPKGAFAPPAGTETPGI